MTVVSRDGFRGKGAVEQEAPEQQGNTSMAGQLGHRDHDALLKASDTDYPEPGESAQHSGAHMKSNEKKPENLPD